MSEGQTLSPAEMEELVGLIMDGDERWQVLTRKLLGSFLLLCVDLTKFAEEIDRGMAELAVLARKLPGVEE